MLRASLTLMAGSALAQVVPLLLGPWLTRLYSPEQWGTYTAFATAAAVVAAVACARYEFALPLAPDEPTALALLRLCLRIFLCVVAICAVTVSLWPWAQGAEVWSWWPLAVAALAAVQVLSMWATRQERFHSLAGGRFVQHGGGAVLQWLAGLAGMGLLGLVLGPAIAALAACCVLAARPPAGGWWQLIRTPSTGPQLVAVARQYRQFPLLNTPHAFLGTLQDAVVVALLVAWSGEVAAGLWGLTLRYLKAPATWVGGAVSQVLYPRLCRSTPDEARTLVRQTATILAAAGIVLASGVMVVGPSLFAWAFGEPWREAGELARALAPYLAAHFVASPLAVVTMAWGAQAWALRVAVVGQVAFLAAAAAGLWLGGLQAAGWCISAVMVVYFSFYVLMLIRWKAIPHAVVDAS